MTRNVLEYLEQSAARFPDKAAFVDEQASLTFGQLSDAAKRIGTALCRLDGEKRPVPVFMNKCAGEIAAFMGVVYAGRAYAPIDPQMPEKRVCRILETLDSDAVIVDSECRQKLEAMGYPAERIFPIEALEAGGIDEGALARVRRFAIDCDLLYVIFTSGSTGYPKGVGVSHRAVIDFVEWLSKTTHMDSTCVFGNQAPFYFDMSVKDIYSTLKHGATDYIIPRQLFNFPTEMFKYILQHGINTLAWATSAVCLVAKEESFEEVCPRTVRGVFFGGEAMPLKTLNLWRKYLPDAMYMNMYGPTETAVDCTYHIVERDRDYQGGLPAGLPCENTGILILNGDRPVKDGEIGEICVRGTSLANGYYNDPEKTAGVFVRNPLQRAYPELIYRTGDNGYYNERGEIMFASRKDDQIKHMGYRIELGEIETALSEIGGVERCCCLFDKPCDKIVCIYTGAATRKEILLELKKYVPKYMWPNKFIQLAEMPLNINGKIDRTGLKAAYIDVEN